MKVKITIEATTDTELLEGMLAAYNCIHEDIKIFVGIKKVYNQSAVLENLARGNRHTKFGGIPSYEISEER